MKLTKRQQQVWELLRQGMDSRTIAKELGISVKTVHVHTEGCKRILGYASTREMAVLHTLSTSRN